MGTVIFDLDGTLADTGGDLIAAANACFIALGHGPMLDPQDDRATAFRGGRAMLALGFGRLEPGATPEDLAPLVDAQYRPLLDHYAANIDHHSYLYPGAEAAVRGLSAAGYKVGICTNKPAGLAETLMARLGARGWFGSLVGADTLPVRKPDPAPFRHAVELAGGDPSRALLVGDTETDRETARAAGVPSILVGFGPEGDGVRRLSPEAVIGHFDELPETVNRLMALAD